MRPVHVPLLPGLICMYFPMTLLGYLALGDNLEADLINSLYPNSFFKSAAQVLFMLNLTTSLVSVISPVYQQLEDSIGIPSGSAAEGPSSHSVTA